MFCPHIKGKCRDDCVKWLPKLNKCSEQLMSEAYIKSSNTAEMFDYLMQLGKITWKLQIKSLMEDPMVPIDVKEAIKEVKDAAALEKLLGDAGLLG